MQFQPHLSRAARRPAVFLAAALLSAALIAAAIVPVVHDAPPYLTVRSAVASAGSAVRDPAAPTLLHAAAAPVGGSSQGASFLKRDPGPLSQRGPGSTTRLRLVKIVHNTGGGTASEADWTLRATGASTNGPTNLAGITPVDSGENFKPDVYALGEQYTGADAQIAAGYTASGWSCVDSGTGAPVEVTTEGKITVRPGDDITCTIVNSYSPPEQPPSSVCPPCRIIGRKLYFAREGPFKDQPVGLSGWLVTATLAGQESLQASTTTNALGEYEFSREVLGAMVYPGAMIRVCEESRPGWVPMSPPCVTVILPTPLPDEYSVPSVDFTNAQYSWLD